MDVLNRLFSTPTALRRWAWASLVGNIAIIATGAIVRLTGSGLGCTTWPRCNDDSYTPRGAVNHHSLIEFGNRMLTFVLILLAVACVVAAIRSRASQQVQSLTWLVAAGIPFQGVVGGLTVLSQLNPFVVALHLMLSLVLVVVLTRLVMITSAAATDDAPARVRTLATGTFVFMMLACWLGTVVTGSGPHSGDGGARRTGFDIETVARIHSLSVWTTVALTIALLVWLLRTHLHKAARWAGLLLVTELIQGAIGYAQYFTGLPAGLVILHLIGAGLSTAAAGTVLFGVRPLPAAHSDRDETHQGQAH